MFGVGDIAEDRSAAGEGLACACVPSCGDIQCTALKATVDVATEPVAPSASVPPEIVSGPVNVSVPFSVGFRRAKLCNAGGLAAAGSVPSRMRYCSVESTFSEPT